MSGKKAKTRQRWWVLQVAWRVLSTSAVGGWSGGTPTPCPGRIDAALGIDKAQKPLWKHKAVRLSTQKKTLPQHWEGVHTAPRQPTQTQPPPSWLTRAAGRGELPSAWQQQPGPARGGDSDKQSYTINQDGMYLVLSLPPGQTGQQRSSGEENRGQAATKSSLPLCGHN